jgi:hypothetical protein
VHGSLPGGVQMFMEEKSTAKIVSDTEQMKKTPIHVCGKTAFVTLITSITFLLFT